MKYFLILLAFLSSHASPKEDIFRALHNELTRNADSLNTQGKAYFLEAYYWEIESISFTFSGGILEESEHKIEPSLNTILRLGSPSLDNTHFDGNYVFGAQVYSPLSQVTDTLLLKRTLWSLFDNQYKKAAEYLAQKKAWRQENQSVLGKQPDFILPKPYKLDWNWTFSYPDTNQLKKALQRASSIWKKTPYLLEEKTHFVHYRSKLYKADNLGNHAYFEFDENTSLQAVLLQKKNGEVFWNYFRESSPHWKNTANLLPQAKQLKQNTLEALKHEASSYRGPLLFSKTSAPAFFEYTLLPPLEDIQLLQNQAIPQILRLKDRLLFPSTWQAQDLPQSKEWKGKKLYGWSPWDHQGQKGKDISIIKNGILKDVYRGLEPVPFFPQDGGNGHHRYQGAHASVLHLKHPASSNFMNEFHKKIQEENLQEAFIVTKLYDTDAAKLLRHPLASHIHKQAPTHDDGIFHLGAPVEMQRYNPKTKKKTFITPLHFVPFDNKSLRFLSTSGSNEYLREPFASFSIIAPEFILDLVDLSPNPAPKPDQSLFFAP